VIRLPWPPGRKARTTAASAAVVLCSSILAPSDAWATPHRGTSAGDETATSGTWGAAASPTAMSWGLSLGQHQTSTVDNTGTVAITAMTYKVVVSNALALTSFTLAACANPWIGGLCNGGAGTAIGGTYGVGSTTTVTSTFVPPLGGNIYVQATESFLVATRITMTLTISVTGTTQTRSPVVTNQ
jgi:hypothetical protein